MFDRDDKVITKVFNPLNVTRSSIIEFHIGKLKDSGLYRFKKIIEFTFGDRSYSRYLLQSNTEEEEYVFEVFPRNNNRPETYLFSLADTIPFSEDFLEVAGQLYLTTPQGDEYRRCVMPDHEDRIDGVSGHAKVYDIESDQVEKAVGVTLWDYERELDGRTEFLNIELWKETGMFRIFTGEIIEDIFYKFYPTSK
ncbi:MAG: hypothetical protein QHH06_04605 [Clostridiales bacterium]|nr:hypothetical protein [Eubacteriales bacterium]MDH7565748.1 hypothetical protein [Clostridiales bacterium]